MSDNASGLVNRQIIRFPKSLSPAAILGFLHVLCGLCEKKVLFADQSPGAPKAMSGKSGAARPVEGRWPANLILDESLTSQKWSRFFYCPKPSKKERDAGLDEFELRARPTMGSGIGGQPNQEIPNNRNTHPCVKPLDLNRYLAGLILPPPRTDAPRRLLVPFSDSGSEMIGGLLADWEDVTSIEKEADYMKLAQARIRHWMP